MLTFQGVDAQERRVWCGFVGDFLHIPMKEINEESLLNISLQVTCCFMQNFLKINQFHGCYDRIYPPIFRQATSLLEGNTL